MGRAHCAGIPEWDGMGEGRIWWKVGVVVDSLLQSVSTPLRKPGLKICAIVAIKVYDSKNMFLAIKGLDMKLWNTIGKHFRSL